ncbi:MAG: TIGR03643 family protein [Flavobacteriales bacterium]|nr:TIGR03643 family protein [Flavobacteriales bacterium]
MSDKNHGLSETDLDRLIEMAWENRTPFEAIQFQFGFTQGQVIKIMRSALKRYSFDLWRKRVNQGISTKHLKKRPEDINRFKCNRQRSISGNEIAKR